MVGTTNKSIDQPDRVFGTHRCHMASIRSSYLLDPQPPLTEFLWSKACRAARAGTDAISTRSGCSLRREAYFSEVLIVVKVPVRAVPTPLTATMIAIAIPAAISPYSMAVAPDSSDKNFTKLRFNSASSALLVHSAHVRGHRLKSRESSQLNLS